MEYGNKVRIAVFVFLTILFVTAVLLATSPVGAKCKYPPGSKALILKANKTKPQWVGCNSLRGRQDEYKVLDNSQCKCFVPGLEPTPGPAPTENPIVPATVGDPVSSGPGKPGPKPEPAGNKSGKFCPVTGCVRWYGALNEITFAQVHIYVPLALDTH